MIVKTGVKCGFLFCMSMWFPVAYLKCWGSQFERPSVGEGSRWPGVGPWWSPEQHNRTSCYCISPSHAPSVSTEWQKQWCLWWITDIKSRLILIKDNKMHFDTLNFLNNTTHYPYSRWQCLRSCSPHVPNMTHEKINVKHMCAFRSFLMLLIPVIGNWERWTYRRTQNR